MDQEKGMQGSADEALEGWAPWRAHTVGLLWQAVDALERIADALEEEVDDQT